LDAAGELAAELAAGGTVAYGAVKRMLHESFANTLETQMEMEARSIAAMSHTHDGREGMDAFLNKRTPQYRGE
jgi:2-(1,2-epoxy-1,2-dihydrophenyl)acetyl-CoA isomerase